MRYFFRRRVPPPKRILLVESGSRHITQAVIPRMRDHLGAGVRIDIVTCFTDASAGLDAGSIFNVNGYRGERMRLLRELRANRYAIAAIICSGEPELNKWKWTLAMSLPSKILVINENADYFWLDYAHWPSVWKLAKYRAGLPDAGIVRALARVIVFPFSFLYLLLYATVAHLRRALHKGFQ